MRWAGLAAKGQELWDGGKALLGDFRVLVIRARGVAMTSDRLNSARRPRVRRLMLSDFRSYEALDLPMEEDLVVLVGENGAGKTNLLEALSLFAPGRGLRRAEMADCARTGGPGGFAVSISLEEDEDEPHSLGVGFEPSGEEAAPERRYRLDRAAASVQDFSERIRVIWLTPAMGGLFLGPASERRRFLDRLVLTLDPRHGARVGQFERALRGRNRLLEEGKRADRWLDAIEREAAELGVAVAAARRECVERLSANIARDRDETSPFPWAAIELHGDVERLASEGPSLAAEERYRALLAENRDRDAAAGRTLIGPHLSDLAVFHGPKNVAASKSSTGEQKALLVGLTLAQAALVAEMSGLAPVALFDELAAHFDPRRRAALFDAVLKLGSQVFVTGADPAVFADLEGRAGFYAVTPGRVAKT